MKQYRLNGRIALGIFAGASIMMASCSSGSSSSHGKSAAATQAALGANDGKNAVVTPKADGSGPALAQTLAAPAIHNPLRVAVAPDGTVVVSYPAGNAVHRFSSALAYLGSVSVPSPLGVAVDNGGRLIVGSAKLGLVAVDAATKTQTPLCTGGGAFSSKPNDIAIEPASGVMWVSDSGNNRVVFCDANGAFIGSVGMQGSGNAQFNFPMGIAYDAANRLVVVVDSGNARVQVLDNNGNYIRQFTTTGLTRPQGVALSGNRVFVTDVYQNRVAEFTLEGVFVRWFGTPGDQAGELLLPSDAAVIGSQLLVASFESKRLEVYNLQSGQ